MTTVRSVNHFAFSTADARREVEFHEGVLGLKTASRDSVTLRGRAGERIVFGTSGDPAAGFLLAYCLGSDGPAGRQGSNGPKAANLSVPAGSLGYWQARLYDAHVETVPEDRFGAKRLSFAHPSGVLYSLVETSDGASGAPGGSVDPAFAIGGLHSVTISLMDVRETHAFLLDVLDAQHVKQDLASGYYQLGADDSGAGIELLHEPYRAPGTWTYAVGTAHHIGLDAGRRAERERLRSRLLDAGYTDVSPAIQDAAFSSVWVRTPGGTLVDLLCLADTG
jgi:glyoxalase family protein